MCFHTMKEQYIAYFAYTSRTVLNLLPFMQMEYVDTEITIFYSISSLFFFNHNNKLIVHTLEIQNKPFAKESTFLYYLCLFFFDSFLAIIGSCRVSTS